MIVKIKAHSDSALVLGTANSISGAAKLKAAENAILATSVASPRAY